MTRPLIRIAGPLLVGALAGVGAIVASTLTRERKQHELTAAPRPLAVEGWWSSDASSSLAHAHPAVLIVDADTARLIDSWDRRIRDRVQRPVVRRTPEWPAGGLIVVDAATGDLLTVVSEHGVGQPRGQGMPAT
ncbi:hypothetical protein [Agrococcus sp. ARC_14]|uniref:hypothetical protein n=1 Tax=Agrococcus sp. ARC_14 TaxID=2919927 RepID=UPI001F052D53|nr:hypothetical protein [Agrococcus sp. ARC_14]MCH1881594.1 hypothetical protein [Agrococcus sp. ARC_14]